VVDPLTKVAVPIGGSFTLAQVRGEMVRQWSDGRATSADGQPQQGAAASVPENSGVIEQHRCVNEMQGERLR
jgi:hypothetical protein